MANTPSGIFKLLWQAFLVIALVAIAWVAGQLIPMRLPGLASAAPAQDNPALSSAASVVSYQVPQRGQAQVLSQINARVAAAQKEIIVVARQIAATSLLTNLKQRSGAGVSVTTLLSPDTTNDFARSRLYSWMRENQFQNVYRDTLVSASHIIVIDSKTVILSDVPFSQRSYEAADQTAVQNGVLGFVYIIDDVALAQSLAATLRPRALPQNKIL